MRHLWAPYANYTITVYWIIMDANMAVLTMRSLQVSAILRQEIFCSLLIFLYGRIKIQIDFNEIKRSQDVMCFLISFVYPCGINYYTLQNTHREI